MSTDKAKGGRDNTKVMEDVATTVQSSKANDIYDRS